MVKNAHIIHMVEDVVEPSYSDGLGYRYICIQAYLPTHEKSTRDPAKVTCKNCLERMK
jgi:hypothetical protein